MATRVGYLIEADRYTDASTFETLRFSLGFDDGYRSLPTDDTVAWFDARTISLPVMTRSVFSGAGSGMSDVASTEVGVGFVVFNNKDGSLDATFKANSGGSVREREFRLYSLAQGEPLASRTLVQRAVMQQVECSRDTVTIRLRDRLYQLTTPHITQTYLGNNALPAGVEGSADLAGKQKPRLWGVGFQIVPKLVNTSKLIYQVCSNELLALTVYCGGDSTIYTVGSAYTSQSDMETNAPSLGEVRIWLAGGMFRLGATPAQPITVDATAHSSGASTAAQLIKALAIERGISTDDISASDVSALDALNAAVCGVWVDDNRSTKEIIDLLAGTVGACVGFDEVGVLRMSRFGVAAGDPDATMAIWNEEAVEQVANDEDIPVTTVRLKYAKYGATPSLTDLGGSLSDATKADLQQEWRVAEATSTPSPNPYARTNSIERETAFAYQADADTEAARLLAQYGTPRGTYLIRNAQLDADTLRRLGPNSVISLRFSRFGFSTETPTLMRVLSIQKQPPTKSAEITVWGNP